MGINMSKDELRLIMIALEDEYNRQERADNGDEAMMDALTKLFARLYEPAYGREVA